MEQSLLSWLQEPCVKSEKRKHARAIWHAQEQISATNNNKSVAIKPTITQVASHEEVSVKRDSVCTRTLSECVPFQARAVNPRFSFSNMWQFNLPHVITWYNYSHALSLMNAFLKQIWLWHILGTRRYNKTFGNEAGGPAIEELDWN